MGKDYKRKPPCHSAIHAVRNPCNPCEWALVCSRIMSTELSHIKTFCWSGDPRILEKMSTDWAHSTDDSSGCGVRISQALSGLKMTSLASGRSRFLNSTFLHRQATLMNGKLGNGSNPIEEEKGNGKSLRLKTIL